MAGGRHRRDRAFDSPTYNGGIAAIGMIPLVTHDMGRIKLNAVYLRKFGSYGEIAAFGFYLGIPLGRWAE